MPRIKKDLKVCFDKRRDREVNKKGGIESKGNKFDFNQPRHTIVRN